LSYDSARGKGKKRKERKRRVSGGLFGLDWWTRQEKEETKKRFGKGGGKERGKKTSTPRPHLVACTAKLRSGEKKEEIGRNWQCTRYFPWIASYG